MTSSHRRPVPCQWFSDLAAVRDHRTAPRLALLFLGVVLARGRRTVISGIHAAKLADGHGDAANYDRTRTFFPENVLAGVHATQPKAWDAIVKNHGIHAA